jgi:NADPH:quinone reductase-like Zn-dependent oxidoreductase
MKAVVYERYGSPDVLRFEEVEEPSPGDGEVLVKVNAVSINDWDWGLLRGTPLVNRALNGPFRPKRHILGSDVAGRVEAIGRGVTLFEPGDAVFGDLTGSWGGFAEYVSAPETALVRKPDVLSWEQAAAIPQAATLARQGLADRGELQPGQSLLINGAGGGVGTFGVQMAKLEHSGEVTGVDSAEKLGMLRTLGFDHTIDYRQDDFATSGRRYDLVLDVNTDRSVFRYARVLAPGGTYVSIGGSMPRVFQAVLLGPLVKLATRKSIRVLGLKPNKDLAHIASLCAEGKIKPVIDATTWDLSRVPEALRYFGDARHQGKVVVTVSPA